MGSGLLIKPLQGSYKGRRITLLLDENTLRNPNFNHETYQRFNFNDIQEQECKMELAEALLGCMKHLKHFVRIVDSSQIFTGGKTDLEPSVTRHHDPVTCAVSKLSLLSTDGGFKALIRTRWC